MNFSYNFYCKYIYLKISLSNNGSKNNFSLYIHTHHYLNKSVNMKYFITVSCYLSTKVTYVFNSVFEDAKFNQFKYNKIEYGSQETLYI